MKLFHVLSLCLLAFAIVNAGPVDSDEDTQDEVDSTEEQSWYSYVVPYVRRVLGASDRDDGFALARLAVGKVRDLLVRYVPAAGSSRASRVLKDNGTSTYSTVDFLNDLESTIQEFGDHVNQTSVQGRSGRTFKDWDYKWLVHHNKFNNKIQAKMNSLLNGPEAESLAVGGGIAAGVMSAVGLGLLLSNMKLVKRIDTEGRTARGFKSWEITNEIDDTIPVVTSLKSAWSRFDETNKGRTLGEKFDGVWYSIKEFFGQNKIFNRLDTLYKSPAVNPASIYGGVGAGLLGALGLGMLFSGAREAQKARSRGRSLDLSAESNTTELQVPQYVFDGIDGVWGAFVSEINATVTSTVVSQNQTQGRRGKALEDDEERTFKKPTLPAALMKWIEKNDIKKISDKIGAVYKAKTPLALAGGATAAAVGVTGLGLLIAGLAKADKYYYANEEDVYANDFDPAYFQQPAVQKQSFAAQQPVQSFGAQRPVQPFSAQQPVQSFDQSFFSQPPAGAQPVFAPKQSTVQTAQFQTASQQGFFPSQQLPLQSHNSLEKQDSRPVKKHVPTTTQGPITEQQVEVLRNALRKMAEGACSQALLCQTLSGDDAQLAQIAYLATVYDSQLGDFRTTLRSLLEASKRRDCTAYKC